MLFAVLAISCPSFAPPDCTAPAAPILTVVVISAPDPGVIVNTKSYAVAVVAEILISLIDILIHSPELIGAAVCLNETEVAILLVGHRINSESYIVTG